MREKQRVFVQEYLKDLNASRAAVRAGYSEKTARTTGCRLLHLPEIAAYLEKQLAERAARCEISQDRVLTELAAIAFSTLTDYVFVDGQGTVRVAPTEGLDARKRAVITGIKEGVRGIEIKLADKVKALELLGKHLGMFMGSGGEMQAGNDPLTQSIEEAMGIGGAFDEAEADFDLSSDGI